ncbi:T9SS C-terminal target domain-containing protein [candidate division KSB1 bacterium]|nr:MAG: T9SS C-terminal target domain-containing protein [candidate division KSB1 bacterium]
MKSLAFFFSTLAFLTSAAFSQPPDTLWTRTHNFGENGTVFKSVSPLPDNGFFVGGHCCRTMYMHTFWVSDFVMRMDAFGNTVWPENPGSEIGTETCDIRTLPDGGCVAGIGMGIGILCPEPAIVRLNANGERQWTASPEPSDWFYDTDTLSAVCRLVDGGFAATGLFNNSSLVFRTDSGGQILWTRSFYPLRPYSITAVGTGCAVAGGDVPFLVQLSDSGDTLWSRQYNPLSLGGRVTALERGANSTYVMAGGLLVADTTRPAFGAIIVADSTGAILSWRTYDCPPFVSMTRCAEGGFILLADRLVRILDNGDTLWTRVLPCDSCTYTSVIQTADSGYLVAGYSGSRWQGNGYLAKFTREDLTFDSRSIPHPSYISLSSFPNPFNPTTTISFSLPHESRTRLAVFDILGREIAVLTDKIYPVGEHKLIFDGSSLPSGIYFARIQSGDYIATHKLLLLK